VKYQKPLVIAAAVLLVAGAVLLPLFLAVNREPGWTYHDPKGFRVKLPTDDWEQVRGDTPLTTFVNRKRSAKVEVVANEESHKDFLEKTVKGVQASVAGLRGKLIGNPEFTEGTNAAGHPYVLYRFQKFGDKGGVDYVAMSMTWCRQKNLTVAVLCEGPLKATSQAEQKSEMEFYEQASKAICLSVE
jgi:hypothetical protein